MHCMYPREYSQGSGKPIKPTQAFHGRTMPGAGSQMPCSQIWESWTELVKQQAYTR
jgi:hypothetical protein